MTTGGSRLRICSLVAMFCLLSGCYKRYEGAKLSAFLKANACENDQVPLAGHGKRTGWCGAYATSQLLKARGKEVEPTIIWDQCRSEDMRGTWGTCLAQAIVAHGLYVCVTSSPMLGLADLLGRYAPIVVLRDSGGGRYHYELAYDSCGDVLVMWDPFSGAYGTLEEDFQEKWRSAGQYMILVDDNPEVLDQCRNNTDKP